MALLDMMLLICLRGHFPLLDLNPSSCGKSLGPAEHAMKSAAIQGLCTFVGYSTRATWGSKLVAHHSQNGGQAQNPKENSRSCSSFNISSNPPLKSKTKLQLERDSYVYRSFLLIPSMAPVNNAQRGGPKSQALFLLRTCVCAIPAHTVDRSTRCIPRP